MLSKSRRVTHLLNNWASAYQYDYCPSIIPYHNKTVELSSMYKVRYGMGKFRPWYKRVVRFFLTRSDGGCGSYGKNRQKQHNLNQYFSHKFCHFGVRILYYKITFRHSHFLSIHDRALLECCPAKSGYLFIQIVNYFSYPNCKDVRSFLTTLFAQ